MCEGLVERAGVAVSVGEDADGLVADLVAVAVGAVEQVAPPPFADAGYVRDLVAESGGDQDAAGAQLRPSSRVT